MQQVPSPRRERGTPRRQEGLFAVVATEVLGPLDARVMRLSTSAGR
jgi:hypothetical protein